MLFHTPLYWIFLLIVVIVQRLLPQQRLRLVWLLISSYAFYSLFDIRFAAILFVLTLANYYFGKQIPQRANPRPVLIAGIALNLGVLGFFKYTNFFLESFAAIIENAEMSPAIQILLPIGISFYTFQGISYLIEIRRGKLASSSSLLDVGLYMAFFPKLIAGPIVRPIDFFEQISNYDSPEDVTPVREHLKLLLGGLFKKIVVADTIAILADVAFRAAAVTGDAGPFPTPLYLQGFYLYAIQIYADFSGYTDIAIASAGLLGFKLPANFREPYFAATVSDFWNRWHMSLTQWFREFLYFPLTRHWLSISKRRYQTVIQITANFLTMLLIGLWHGAAWTFVLWGLWHAALLTLERLARWQPRAGIAKFLGGILTFHLVAAGWVVFRAETLAQAGSFFQGLFAFDQMHWLHLYLPSIAFAFVLIFIIDILTGDYVGSLKERITMLQPVWVVGSIFVIFSLLLLSSVTGSLSRPFIYGQF